MVNRYGNRDPWPCSVSSRAALSPTTAAQPPPHSLRDHTSKRGLMHQSRSRHNKAVGVWGWIEIGLLWQGRPQAAGRLGVTGSSAGSAADVCVCMHIHMHMYMYMHV